MFSSAKSMARGVVTVFGRFLVVLIAAGVVMPMAGIQPASAEYPERQVTIVVPYGPGGATSNFGQMLADHLTRMWGQPVIVENRPGAGSSIGSAHVAQAEADGYTILLGSDAAFVTNEFIFKDLGFDPRADLTPVTRLANVNYALLVSSRIGIKDLKTFIDTMRKKGAEYNYGSVGGGDASRLGMETLKQEAKLGAIVEIPYTGMANAVQGLVSGDHDILMVSVRTSQPHIDSGAAVPLVISGASRAPNLPDVPTFAEEGYPQIQVGFFLGAAVPAGTDPEIVGKIATSMAEVLKKPEVRTTYVDQLGYELVGSTPDTFGAFVAAERERVGKLVEALGIEKQ